MYCVTCLNMLIITKTEIWCTDCGNGICEVHLDKYGGTCPKCSYYWKKQLEIKDLK